MNKHHYQNQQLQLENLSIAIIAEHIKTPFYCYSESSIIDAYNAYHYQLNDIDHFICYALKANSNQAIIKILADLGAGADVVSEGELRRAIKAGIPANKIVYSGVAKTDDEMRYALSQDIFQFNVESINELHLLSKIASNVNKIAAISFRINPDVDANTHAKISTGLAENKFGIPISKAREIYQVAATLPGIKVQGVDVHIGSQLTQLAPFKQAFALIHQLVLDLRNDGHTISVVDVGGGLGVDYGDIDVELPAIADYCDIVKQQFKDLNCKLVFEPGRSIVAHSGLLISKVVYKKQGEERTFAIIDAAMNDLLRPSMYDAHHPILPVTKSDDVSESKYDIVGPVCETGDTFARNRLMPEINEGDLIAIANSGAYGAAMSSTYNTRLQVPEVLVKGDMFSVIKIRISYDELFNHDLLAEWQI